MNRELLCLLHGAVGGQSEGSRKLISFEFLVMGMKVFEGWTGTDPSVVEYWLKDL